MKFAKWLFVSGIVFGVLMIAANFWYISSTEARLQRQMAALKAAGEPLDMSQLRDQPIPPEENGATYLLRAADDLRALEDEFKSLFPESTTPSGPLTDEQQAKIGAALDARPNALSLLEQASRCEQFGYDHDATLPFIQFQNSLMERVSLGRTAARVMRTRVAWLVAQGKHDEALDACLVMLRLSRLLDQEPTAVSYLVSVACAGLAFEATAHVLQTGSISAERRQQLDEELALHDSFEGLRWALQTERVWALKALRELPNYNRWLMRGQANSATSYLIEVTQLRIDDTQRPFREVHEEWLDRTVPKRTLNPFQVAVELLTPALDALREPAERTRAQSRCLRVLNALQQKSLADQGPVELKQLGLPEQATVDPYTQEPLIVVKTESGWNVYARGKNFQDDGGKFEKQEDIGVWVDGGK